MALWLRRRPEAVFVALVIMAMIPVVALVVFPALGQRDEARRVIGAEVARVGRLAALRQADLASNPKLRARSLVTLRTWACILPGELAAGRGVDAQLSAPVLAHSGAAAMEQAICVWR